MPVSFDLDPAGRFAVVTVTDPYLVEEWRRATDEALASSPFRAHRAMLVDRRLSAAPTTAFVGAIVAYLSDHQAQFSDARVAIVVRDDTGYGMGRMTQLKGEDNVRMNIEPFRDYEQAVRWLITP